MHILPGVAPSAVTPALPWGSRVRRTSDDRCGTVISYDAEFRMVIRWDDAAFPDRHAYTRDELATSDFQVFPAVTHCSGCGDTVGDEEIEDGYTTCCNEGACGPCAAVNGLYQCGTVAPDAPTT